MNKKLGQIEVSIALHHSEGVFVNAGSRRGHAAVVAAKNEDKLLRHCKNALQP